MLRTLSVAEVGHVMYPWLVTMVTCLQITLADPDNKKVPPTNLTVAETEMVELALKYHAVIKNKKSDEVTVYLSCVQNSNNNKLSSSLLNST